MKPHRPVRVLIVAPSPALLGGISSLARTMVERLRCDPFVHVEFLPIDPKLPGPLRSLQAVRYVRTVVTSLLYCLLLPWRVLRCDVVHLYSASYTSFLLSSTPAILVAKLLRRAVLLNYHSGNAEGHLLQWRRTAVPTLRLVDEIVVSSEFLARVFEQFGLCARVLPSPIDLDPFCFHHRGGLRPVFLTSRLLEPIYNVACVLRAFARIQHAYPGARLTVAGEGWQRAELEALASDLGLTGVEFVGRVPAHQMPDYYRRADVYVSATDVDNVPSSIVEAMAAGLPVVTTNAGGIPYLLTHGETCLMVARGDHDALAAAALRLLTHPELATRIAGRARVECRRYAWEHVRNDWMELYGRWAAHPREGAGGLGIAAVGPE